MPAKIDRTGEINIAKNGMEMKIDRYGDVHDIDVKFEDGTIVKNKTYRNFKNGKIKNPNFSCESIYKTKKIGEIRTLSNGLTAKIIKWNNYEDIDVEFLDGTIVRHKSYRNFKKGKIAHPNYYRISRIGESRIAKNGQTVTIVEYNKSIDIIVEFDDKYHTRVKTTYASFKKGEVRNPNHIGETSVSVFGLNMSIVEYNNNENIVVEYDDKLGTRIKTRYYNFRTGKVKNPHFPMGGKKGTYKTFETQYAYTAPDGSVYFYCECQECGWKKNLTARELINLNHKCEGTKDDDV